MSRKTSSEFAVGSCSTPNPTASRAVVTRGLRVTLRAELGAADILDAHQRPVGGAFQDDVVELGRLASAGPRRAR